MFMMSYFKMILFLHRMMLLLKMFAFCNFTYEMALYDEISFRALSFMTLF